ncbi:MAG: polyhydroxyalkanoate synthesis repressor PhaR [Robiginitomaculum sp.]|nr:polyhydroxyalkanoate synthesis repressor PhaR [Robiginitomaculum sp.]MDQ7076570.1 polyhydroxyalkanoate synthesis repressor PhaR [Robiginitomaculum sp.]
MAKSKTNANDPVVIKKYANRRLYDTTRSAYITLDDLKALVHEGTDFVVQDAKSGEDLTHSVLTQIIFEQEAQGQHLLPVDFLRQLIRFYGDSMQNIVPGFLDMSMNSLAQSKERFAKQMGSTATNPLFGLFEEQVRQNMALFESTLKSMSSFGTSQPEPKSEPAAPAKRDDDLDELRAQMAAMQEKLDKLG